MAWAWAADPGTSPPYGLWQLILGEFAVQTDDASLRVRIGGRRLSFLISAGGDIQAG